MSDIELKKPLAYQSGQDELPNFIMAGYDYIRIIFFELMGTAIFAYGICCSQNQPPPYPTPDDYVYVPNPAHTFFVSLSLFLAICWCGELTGGHCNPAVTTVFILKKDSDITLRTGLLYMISQIAGAFFGCFLAWLLVDNITAPIVEDISVRQQFTQFGGEIIGTFIFTLFILVITCKDTTFLHGTLWIYLSIVTALFVARTFSFRTEGLNPALAIGMELFYAMYHQSWTIFADSWVLIVGPFIGAVLASITFQQIYKPLTISWMALKK